MAQKPLTIGFIVASFICSCLFHTIWEMDDVWMIGSFLLDLREFIVWVV